MLQIIIIKLLIIGITGVNSIHLVYFSWNHLSLAGRSPMTICCISRRLGYIADKYELHPYTHPRKTGWDSIPAITRKGTALLQLATLGSQSRTIYQSWCQHDTRGTVDARGTHGTFDVTELAAPVWPRQWNVGRLRHCMPVVVLRSPEPVGDRLVVDRKILSDRKSVV